MNVSGFTAGAYDYVFLLNYAPTADSFDAIVGVSNATTSLTFTDFPATTGDTALWSGGPYDTATYTGFTHNGDPIVSAGGAYYLVSNTDYQDLSYFTPDSGDFTCYCGGTLILTDCGDVPVEDLAIGDTVVTADGGRQPVRWIGHRRLRCHNGRFMFADPLLVNPIRIRAGALGENLPRRDLRVSPEHAILVGDVLVQAGALVNDVSILREDHLPEVLTYYHVELAEHALLLGEGVAAESFVDNVNRLSFDNGAEHEAMIGGAPSIVEMAYPRAQSHRQVPPAIHAALMDRARALLGDLAA
jgi:hypothetical protein